MVKYMVKCNNCGFIGQYAADEPICEECSHVLTSRIAAEQAKNPAIRNIDALKLWLVKMQQAELPTNDMAVVYNATHVDLNTIAGNVKNLIAELDEALESKIHWHNAAIKAQKQDPPLFDSVKTESLATLNDIIAYQDAEKDDLGDLVKFWRKKYCDLLETNHKK